MARNKEKQLGRLNRLWLQQLDEEEDQRNPSRPGLGSLHTAMEVKQWLPSIKKDIDYYLKQSQVISYPQQHIEEFSQKIDALTREYRAYVRKLRELEPGTGAVPWTERAYSRKHKADGETKDDANSVKQHRLAADEPAPSASNGESVGATCETDPPSTPTFIAISTPVLDTDDTYRDVYGYDTEPSPVIYNADPLRENLPLEFIEPSDMPTSSKEVVCMCVSKEDSQFSPCASSNTKERTSGQTNHGNSSNSCDMCRLNTPAVTQHEQPVSTADRILDTDSNKGQLITGHLRRDNSCENNDDCRRLPENKLPLTLNLPYSDSSSDEES